MHSNSPLSVQTPEPNRDSSLPRMTDPGITEKRPSTEKCELLSPAGEIDSAYAAIHYGADAIYLGMKKFSARAEAQNFTPDELSEITAFAHAATPRRRVFVTVNTLVLNSEISRLVDIMAVISDVGVDAIIVQDLGVINITKRFFPKLALHASTQLAIHNLAGALTLRDLGFRRVTLARELTLAEIRNIAAKSGIEVEVFIHGALCYSYSGLCLYSSMLRGSSGNRGRCNYPCRDSFETSSGRKSFPFSMKDLALPDEIISLREAGVTSFKIEGRKKSPLYVAATTSYYRKLLDGKAGKGEKQAYESDIKTIFSRPWSDLYVKSESNMSTVDTETVGHRGAPIGQVSAVLNPGLKNARLQFKTERPIERHDGIQIDLPGRPFGFPVDTLLLMTGSGNGQGKTVFEAPSGSLVQVGLPQDHPEIPENATIYCSSSQSVKRRYKFSRPKPGEFKVHRDITVEVVFSASRISATASHCTLSAEAEVSGIFETGKKPEVMDKSTRQAFEKLGDTEFKLAAFLLKNPDKLFVPVSLLNRLRREVVSNLKARLENMASTVVTEIKSTLQPVSGNIQKEEVRWSIKTDSFSNISSFAETDWQEMRELVVDIRNETAASLEANLEKYSSLIGKSRIRLALPVITRASEERFLLEKIDKAFSAGWTKWEVANLSAWQYLIKTHQPSLPVFMDDCKSSGFPISSDFSLYVLNRAAALQLEKMGVSNFVLSPEDGIQNMSSLLLEFGNRATVIAYQDTPLFISENCAYSNISGKCKGRNKCFEGETPLVSGKKEHVVLVTEDCRSIVVNKHPYCAASHLKELTAAGARHFRADFIYRKYDPLRVVEIWRALRKGNRIPSTTDANLMPGMVLQ